MITKGFQKTNRDLNNSLGMEFASCHVIRLITYET
jgi:hypothetical protein